VGRPGTVKNRNLPHPAIEAGKITYSKARVVVSGQIRSAGFNVVVGYLENFGNQGVFNMASKVFTDILNRPDIKRTFYRSAQLQPGPVTGSIAQSAPVHYH